MSLARQARDLYRRWCFINPQIRPSTWHRNVARPVDAASHHSKTSFSTSSSISTPLTSSRRLQAGSRNIIPRCHDLRTLLGPRNLSHKMTPMVQRPRRITNKVLVLLARLHKPSTAPVSRISINDFFNSFNSTLRLFAYSAIAVSVLVTMCQVRQFMTTLREALSRVKDRCVSMKEQTAKRIAAARDKVGEKSAGFAEKLKAARKKLKLEKERQSGEDVSEKTAEEQRLELVKAKTKKKLEDTEKADDKETKKPGSGRPSLLGGISDISFVISHFFH